MPQALCPFAPTLAGLTDRRLRPLVVQPLAVPDDRYTSRRMGDDPRRLARTGVIARGPGKRCYTLTPYGRRTARFLSKAHARLLRPEFWALDPQHVSHAPSRLRTAPAAVDAATEALVTRARFAA